MTTVTKLKPVIIIAGPGAGKTHNMVEKIIKELPRLSPCRYMVVITYTNAATQNIQTRLARRITIPENVFIGTIHSFLNKFVIMPFSSLFGRNVGKEKLFMQLGIEDVFQHLEKKKPKEKRASTPEARAMQKAKISTRLNELGYITFDQTLAIAKKCVEEEKICRILSNRLQYLFVDEFQDADNHVFSIIESLRKQNKTTIYCVGDPEQYIQSFDSTIKAFANIPILKAAAKNTYSVEMNTANFRCSENIVKFLNRFNGRVFPSGKFQQLPHSKDENAIHQGQKVCFITAHTHVKDILDIFYSNCDRIGIALGDRCIITKKNDTLERIASAVNQNYKNPKKSSNLRPVKMAQDSLLTTLNLQASAFFEKYRTDMNGLRKNAIQILRAVYSDEITDENTYGKFVTEKLGLELKTGLPIRSRI